MQQAAMTNQQIAETDNQMGSLETPRVNWFPKVCLATQAERLNFSIMTLD